MLIVSVAFAAAPSPGPCAATTTSLTQTVEEALRSVEHLEPDKFVAATDELDRLLPCLAEPMSRHLAAEIHRTKGIRAVSERDPDARTFFAAARALEPAYKLPSTLIPDGHPVRTEYAAFDLTTGGFDPIPAPQEGTLTLDANARLYRPTSWPTIAQYLSADGSVRFTVYLEPGAALPEYPVANATGVVLPPFVPPPPPPGPLPAPVKASPKVPLGVAAITGAALTGVFLGVSGWSEARFKDLETPDEDLLAFRQRANSFVLASAVTGAASVGLGIGFVAVR